MKLHARVRGKSTDDGSDLMTADEVIAEAHRRGCPSVWDDDIRRQPADSVDVSYRTKDRTWLRIRRTSAGWWIEFPC
jgi:hypothetical protein